MASSYSHLLQSKYFSPAFNSAIFDGPFRIYFAQFQEVLALRIYFLIQQKFADNLPQIKELSKKAESNILIMLYPTNEIYRDVFAGNPDCESGIIVESWNRDTVIGATHSNEDKSIEEILTYVGQIVSVWQNSPIVETPQRPPILTLASDKNM